MLDDKEAAPESGSAVDWLEPSAARYQLKNHISLFLRTHETWQGSYEGDPPPVLGLKVSAGHGKTHTSLGCIAEQGDTFLKRGHILFYVPTLELAVEAEKTFRAPNLDLPSAVLRGRSAPNPETGAPMCARSEIARALAGSVASVTQSICRR